MCHGRGNHPCRSMLGRLVARLYRRAAAVANFSKTECGRRHPSAFGPGGRRGGPSRCVAAGVRRSNRWPRFPGAGDSILSRSKSYWRDRCLVARGKVLRRHACPPGHNPAAQDDKEGEPATGYSGMLPCFLGGLRSRLLRSMAKAVMSLRRVNRGSMISSTYPRSAAM